MIQTKLCSTMHETSKKNNSDSLSNILENKVEKIIPILLNYEIAKLNESIT